MNDGPKSSSTPARLPRPDFPFDRAVYLDGIRLWFPPRRTRRARRVLDSYGVTEHEKLSRQPGDRGYVLGFSVESLSVAAVAALMDELHGLGALPRRVELVFDGLGLDAANSVAAVRRRIEPLFPNELVEYPWKNPSTFYWNGHGVTLVLYGDKRKSRHGDGPPVSHLELRFEHPRTLAALGVTTARDIAALGPVEIIEAFARLTRFRR